MTQLVTSLPERFLRPCAAGNGCEDAPAGAVASAGRCSTAGATGTWRSLVAHLTGGQGVAGSNPVVPTVRTAPDQQQNLQVRGRSSCDSGS